MTKDLTVGAPSKAIISFALPVFFGMLFQQLYNMVDTMIVGKYLGIDALAGVGATASLFFLVIGSIQGICNGFAIPIAQMFGAKNDNMLRRFTAACAVLCTGLALIITLVTTLFCKGMLTLMKTPEGAFDYAYVYILIIFLGIPFTFLYNMVSAVVRSLGDSRTPVVFLVISSVLNIVLDLLFIIAFKMGVAGAALATVLSQGVSGIASFIYLKKKFTILKLSKSDWTPTWFAYWRLCAVGLPMGAQYTITAIGTIVVQTAINGFGESTVAGVTAAQKIYSLISCPLEALGTTMATYTGQNIGAGRFDRVNKGLLASTLMGIGFSVVIFLAMLVVGDEFSLLFIDKEETGALADAFKYTVICTAGFPLLTFISTFRFTIQGMGYSPLAMIAGVLEMIARCFVGLVLPGIIGYTSICLSSPAAWLTADLFLIPAFFYCRNKAMKQYLVPDKNNGHKTIV
ncbi:MAG: MATE family efflux transporter [Lachnospiraceae bacterium]|nr:MATE family efflux transporter [Lachnospiraceae bacterium]